MVDFTWIDSTKQLEKSTTLSESRIIKRQLRLTTKNAMKCEIAADILRSLPQPGESWHIVGNGSFDYYSFIPVIVDLLGGTNVVFHGSTWTMNRENVIDLLSLFDQGKISQIAMLTGLYFKRRESSVYASLIEGLQERGQRFMALENHAKVTLLQHADSWIVMEGSANYTANPRIEQYCIINDQKLYDFHKLWMDEALS